MPNIELKPFKYYNKKHDWDKKTYKRYKKVYDITGELHDPNKFKNEYLPKLEKIQEAVENALKARLTVEEAFRHIQYLEHPILRLLFDPNYHIVVEKFDPDVDTKTIEEGVRKRIDAMLATTMAFPSQDIEEYIKGWFERKRKQILIDMERRKHYA